MVDCKLLGEVFHHPLYIIPIVYGGLTALFTFLLVFVIWKNYAHRIYYHTNVVVLLSLKLFSCVVMAISSVLSTTTFLINWALKTYRCTMLLRTGYCFSMRVSFLGSFILLTTSHIGLVIERIYATYHLRTYEKQGCLLGILLAFCSVITSTIVGFIVLIPEDPEELITSCLTFSTSKVIYSNIFIMFLFQLFIDILLVFIHGYILNLNLDRQKLSTELSEKYQQSENIKILQHTLPLILTSVISIGIYISDALVFQSSKNDLPQNWYDVISANLLILPHLPFLLTLTMLISLEREFKQRKVHHQQSLKTQKEFNRNYFEGLRKKWDRYKPSTRNRVDVIY